MKTPALLERTEFSCRVIERDGGKCVACGRDDAPLDAHHIIERRLFSDGGYYLENGATLCDRGPDGCHMRAEQTLLSVEELRDLCGIKQVVLPDELYPDHVYDKWGNSILENGMRTKGPLFEDPSVQKVLEPVLHLFTDRVKYPRTWHLPWSDGVTSDDKQLKDTSLFEGRRVIVTEKLDGENTSLYNDGYLHARSVDGRSHSSRDWAKAFWSHRSFDLPAGWRVVCENLYAKHSIAYDGLPGYLIGFAIYDDQNVCLSHDDALEWFELLDIPAAPVMYDGIFDEAKIRALYDPSRDYDVMEGYVVRLADSFPYRDFAKSVAKFVRKDHVMTTRHWARGPIVPNGIADGVQIARDLHGA